MPEYAYEAIDCNGHNAKGVMFAEDEFALEQRLRIMDYWLIKASTRVKSSPAHRGNVTRMELAEFFNGVASLLAAGVTAADALKAMVEETTNDSFRLVLEDIELNLNSGSSLADAFGQYPRIFSEQILNLIRAGEYSGQLNKAFKDLAEHIEWTQRLKGDVKQASLYPTMVIGAVIGLITLMLTFVVPRFAVIFEELGMDLPVLTAAVVVAGEWASTYGLAFLVCLVCAGFTCFWMHGRSEAFRDGVAKLQLELPVFGEIMRMLVLSRFVHNMELMVAAGVPVLEALSMCRGIVGNRIMEKAVIDAEMAVHDGRRVSDALRKHQIVSPLVLRMLVVGEETGRLDEALSHVARRLDEEIPRRIKRAFGFLEPAIMMTIIGVVGLIGGSLFLPMFSLMSGI